MKAWKIWIGGWTILAYTLFILWMCRPAATKPISPQAAPNLPLSVPNASTGRLVIFEPMFFTPKNYILHLNPNQTFQLEYKGIENLDATIVLENDGFRYQSKNSNGFESPWQHSATTASIQVGPFQNDTLEISLGKNSNGFQLILERAYTESQECVGNVKVKKQIELNLVQNQASR